MWTKTTTEDIKKTDPIVESVVSQFQERSRIGIDKYGLTLQENNLSLIEWLEHLKQEMMDATLYIERAKQEIISRRNSEEQ
jgi:tRNA A37 threonylcarbamoyladenosine biosynthesis protein TsaE